MDEEGSAEKPSEVHAVGETAPMEETIELADQSTKQSAAGTPAQSTSSAPGQTSAESSEHGTGKASSASQVPQTQGRSESTPSNPLEAETHRTAPPVQAPVEYEQFSGFRITNRCFTAAQVAAQLQGVRVLRFPKLAELRKRAECNRVVIGVLYSCGTGRLGNGELYMKWCLTDLAEPEPGRLIVQLRGRAYEHWRKPTAVKVSERQSIFAIMNPREPLLENDEWTVRVENPNQLAKLGACPSLRLCDMKGCQLPCNVELRDRFCKMHLSLAYANKGGRGLTGGNLLANLLEKAPKRKPRPQGEVDEDEEKEVAVERAESAKRVKTAVAMQLDERRFLTFEANDNYLRSIKEGSRADDSDTSRVPVLGRAFKEDSSLELDMATVDLGDKGKANRVIERMVEKRAERRVVDDCPPENDLHLGIASRQTVTSTKVQASSTGSKKAPKKSLVDLMEDLRGRKAARRAGVASEGRARDRQVNTQPKEQPAASSSGSVSQPPDDIPHEQHVMTINKLFGDLSAAGSDIDRIKAVLDAADKLPISILEGPEGGKFYAAVGSLTMHSSRADIRRAALLARRRWRSASFDARQSAEMHPECPAGAPQDVVPQPSGDASAGKDAAGDLLSAAPASDQPTTEEGLHPECDQPAAEEATAQLPSEGPVPHEGLATDVQSAVHSEFEQPAAETALTQLPSAEALSQQGAAMEKELGLQPEVEQPAAEKTTPEAPSDGKLLQTSVAMDVGLQGGA